MLWIHDAGRRGQRTTEGRASRLVGFALLSAMSLTAAGCVADVEHDGDALEGVDEGALAPLTPRRVCAGDFFDRHPVTGTSVDSTGAAMPQPFAACDSEFTVISGTVDYAAAAERTAGSGYEPLKLAGGRAVALLFAVDFGKTDVGSYEEFVVGYDVVPSGTPNPELPWVNDYSAMVPSFLPTTEVFLDRLILQRGSGDRAIRAGREFSGLDKRPGTVRIHHTNGGRRARTNFVVLDERHMPVAVSSVSVDPSPASQFAEANLLAAALGLPDASVLPPSPQELPMPLVNTDLRQPGSVYRWSGIFDQPKTAMGRFGTTDRLVFGKGELGRRLSRMAFAPKTVVRYFDVNIVYPER